MPKLSRLVRGDLDWIVMKALEKDRTHRYETANGLAADIDRHLKSEPVTAAAPTFKYQLWKFYRRHKGYVVTAAVVTLLLAFAISFSTFQAVRATRAWAAADRARLAELAEKAIADERRMEAEELRKEAIRQKELIEKAAVTSAIRRHESELSNHGVETNLTRALFHVEKLVELDPENSKWTKLEQELTVRQIPDREPNIAPQHIDLSPFYNFSLTEGLHDVRGNDFSPLSPFGLKMLERVDLAFDIRGIVHLNNRDIFKKGVPKSVEGIPVGMTCKQIHLLYSAAFGRGPISGTPVCRFEFNYGDERTEILNLNLVDHVLDWHDFSRNVATSAVVPRDERVKLAWTGNNEHSRQRNSRIQLFCLTWTNPHEEVVVESIDFISEMNRPAPFLIAITVE